jgi:hypothetical protein
MPSRATLAAAAALALCAGPQEIRQYLEDGGMPPDATYQPPSCGKAGPSFSCTADGTNPTWLLIHDRAQFHCTVPTGDRTAHFKPVKTDHPELTLGADQDPSTGLVVLQVQKIAPGAPFPDTALRVFVTLAWDDDSDACTVLEVDVDVVGSLWVADPDDEQILVLDNSGAPLGDPLKLEGISSPRLLLKVPDGVLVGGTSGTDDVLAVYDYSGRRLREVPGATALLGNKPLHAGATLGDVVYFTTGMGPTDALLYRAQGGDPATLHPKVGALASLGPDAVIAALSSGANLLKLTAAAIEGEPPITPSYRDTDGKTCSIQGAAGAVALSSGGFALALRHGDASGSPTLAMLAVFDSQFQILQQTAHKDSDESGLIPHTPYDWLEELRPGLLLGAREAGTGVERIAVDAIGTDDAHAVQPDWAAKGLLVKGVLRLR